MEKLIHVYQNSFTPGTSRQSYPKKILAYSLVSGVTQDLYEKNWVTHKHGYGTDLLNDGTYTGEATGSVSGSDYTTDTGIAYVASGRYKDTSAILWFVGINPSANITTTTSSGFGSFTSAVLGEEVSRYVRSDLDCTIYIEVGTARQNFVSYEANILAKNFPTWTDIYTSSGSVGRQFLNVPAKDMEPLKIMSMSFAQNNIFTLAPTSQIYRAYTTEISDDLDVITVSGDTQVLGCAEDYIEFIEAPEEYIYIKDGNRIFTTKEFTTFSINGTIYKQQEFLIGNTFDQFAAQFNLSRLENETNAQLRTRVLDVYVNLPGAHEDGLLHAIPRESGATVNNIYELSNNELPWNPYPISPTGEFPYQEHIALAEWINANANNTWGYGKTNTILWQDEDVLNAYGEVPYLFDETLARIETGIGFGDDLYIDMIPAPSSVAYNVSSVLNGVKEVIVSYYPEVEINGTVHTSGNVIEYDNGTLFTATIKAVNASGTWVRSFSGDIPGDIYVSGNTNVGIIPVRFRNDFTENMTWNSFTSSGVTADFPWSSPTAFNLVPGTWVPSSLSYIDDTYPAIISFASGSTVGSLTSSGDNAPSSIYATSTKTASSSVVWVSPDVPFSISCNGTFPAATTASSSIASPVLIEIPANITSPMSFLTVVSAAPCGCTYTIAFNPTGTATTNVSGFTTSGTTIRLSSAFQQNMIEYQDFASSGIVSSGTLNYMKPYTLITIPSASYSIPSSFVENTGYYTLSCNSDVTARMLDYSFSPTGAMLLVMEKGGTNPAWYTGVHGGTYYMNDSEWFMHSGALITENIPSGDSYVLGQYPGFGYPISISSSGVDIGFREIQVLDSSGNCTTTITETASGNGENYLRLAYSNPTGLVITESPSSTAIVPSATSEGVVDIGFATSSGAVYTMTYKADVSYCIDYNYIASGDYRAKIYFDKVYDNLSVTYSPYEYIESQSSLSIPISPIYTHKREGFLYMTDEVKEVDTVSFITPKVLYKTETNDIWVRLLDTDSNAVSGTVVAFTASGGDLQSLASSAISDTDGYAITQIVCSGTSDINITASASNGAWQYVTYTVLDQEVSPSSTIVIFGTNYDCADTSYPDYSVTGTVYDPDYHSVSGATVNVKITLPDLTFDNSSVITDSSGRFVKTYTPTLQGRYVVDYTYGIAVTSTGWVCIES